MKKSEFLTSLHNHLGGLPKREVDDILRDQEEYFRDAMSAGRSEEEVVRSLGDPKVFAANLKAELTIQRAESSTDLRQKVGLTASALFSILALAPINFFLVLGPFLLLLIFLLAGWILSAAGVIVAIALSLVFYADMLKHAVGFLTHFSAISFTFACIGASVLCILIMMKLTHWFVIGTLSYLNWNIRFVKARV